MAAQEADCATLLCSTLLVCALADGVKRTVMRLPRERGVKDIEAAPHDAFAANGYARTTVAKIASRAGAAEGTVYTFFPTKCDLVVRVVELWYEARLQALTTVLQGIHGAANKMRFISFTRRVLNQ